MDITPIRWDGAVLQLLDQTLLPFEERYLVVRTVEELCEAIQSLRVRGAPLLGVAGALGVVAVLRSSVSTAGFFDRLNAVCDQVAGARPTAVNLRWAVCRVRDRGLRVRADGPAAALSAMQAEAEAVFEEDKTLCRRIGGHGAALVCDGDNLLTHCNAGGLATSGYGTALAVMFSAREQGKTFHVYVDETRPLLQGARLTAWELQRCGIPCTLICDNMAASLMGQGRVNRVFVGADRIARNGDAANKIGTYGVAVLARHHKVPFYVAAPYSTIDASIPDGGGIPIEQRDGAEVRRFGRSASAQPETPVYNPAFDVTPASLIDGIVTERGVLTPPLDLALQTQYGAPS